MQPSEKKTLSCSNCRKRKRKCDGGHPCSSCSKKSITCDYNTTDRRSQRYSVGYIKSLETNNDVLENTLAELVTLRNSPEELAAKLESISVSFPKRVERPEFLSSDIIMDEDFEPSENEEAEKPFITEKDQYFGAGSVYHCRSVPTQKQEPLLARKFDSQGRVNDVVTLERNFDYVAGLVRGYFNNQYHGTQHALFDKKRILFELENRNFSGPFLNTQLVYAICANCELLTYQEADAYCDFVLQDLFLETVALSIAVSQCYTLLAMHCASKGQISKAWLFAGIGIRVGLDVGFDMCHGENACSTANRCFMGTLVIDQYLAMSLGRRPSLQQNSVPVLRLEGETDVDYLNAKYSVELIEMTKHMIRLTYQPVIFDKDPKVNYLLKFNRLKVFNMKLLKWRQNLDPACSWLYTSLKSSKNLAKENHTLKFLYYYLLIFLNKPFLHVPKQHSTVFLIEEMAKEVYLIVHLKLVRINEETGLKIQPRESPTEPLISSNKFCSASMDICVVMLLANVLMTLMTSQQAHYIHLEKQFKAFAHYINYINLRKYDAAEKPMAVLLKKFEAFKAKMRDEMVLSDDKSSDHEQSNVEDEQNSELASKSSPPTSDYSNSTSQVTDSELAGKPNPTVMANSVWEAPAEIMMRQTMPLSIPLGSPKQDSEHFAFDPWWQELNYETSPPQSGHLVNGQNMAMPQNTQFLHGNVQPQMPFFVQDQTQPAQSEVYYPQPRIKQEMTEHSTQRYSAPDGFPSYDYLPKSKDPVDQMLNLLFSNTGVEFTTDRDRLDWDSLFKGQ